MFYFSRNLCLVTLVTPNVRCIPRHRGSRTVIHFSGTFARVCVRVFLSVCLFECTCVIVSSGGRFSIISAARLCGCERVCVHAGERLCVCTSPIYSDIISDWKPAFSRTFGKHVMDGRTDGREGTRPDTRHQVLRNTSIREGVTDLRTDGQTQDVCCKVMQKRGEEGVNW